MDEEEGGTRMPMARKVRDDLTLEEFLQMPEIDERPYLEYIDGRIEAKVSPQRKHCALATELLIVFNQFVRPRGLGRAFGELRCTFAGRSIVPDVVFQLAEHIPCDEYGEMADDPHCIPDIHIEIVSPRQGASRAHRKLSHSTANGCPLGILINPGKRKRGIDVYRPGLPPERLDDDGAIDMAPVLPGLVLPVAEVFGWLRLEPEGAGPA
jgi:Uma2 family endonuclease